MTDPRFDTRFRPVEIRYKKEEKKIEVDWDDGKTMAYPAEFLRVVSPSAEVQGHGPGQKMLVPGRRHVGIMAVEPVGNYAVRIKFDDLHDTGIYSWQYLREIGEGYEAIWAEYLAALEAKGLSRDPPKRK
ncbi:MAG: gamma-butyrobetaine hydroxylase-like domain-containing protein [Rhodospirillales bacterium]